MSTPYYVNVAATVAIIATNYDMHTEGTQDFVGGFMKALIDKDDLSVVRTCLKDPEGLEQEITEALSEIQKGTMSSVLKGVQELSKMVKELPTDLEDCEELKPDVEALSKWGERFNAPVTLAAKATARLTKNWMTASSLCVDMASYYTNGDFKQTGFTLGELTILAYGAVDKADLPPEDATQVLYLF